MKSYLDSAGAFMLRFIIESIAIGVIKFCIIKNEQKVFKRKRGLDQACGRISSQSIPTTDSGSNFLNSLALDWCR